MGQAAAVDARHLEGWQSSSRLEAYILWWCQCQRKEIYRAAITGMALVCWMWLINCLLELSRKAFSLLHKTFC